MNIFTLLSTVAACLLMYLLVKSFHDRFTGFITIAVAIFLLFFICTKLSSVFTFVQHLAESVGVNNKYFKIVLKGISICYLCEFTVSACKDCGQAGWGEKVELACRCTILVMSIPMFEDFLDILTGFLK